MSLKYFVSDCLWNPFLDSNSLQIPSNLIFFFPILVTLRPFTLCYPKTRTIKLQNRAKIFLGNWFSELFAEIEI